MFFRFLPLSFLVAAIAAFFPAQLRAQFGLPQARLSDERVSEYVIENARLVTEPGRVIPNGSMYVRDGIIVSLGTGLRVPDRVLRIDLKGAWVYPSFIDLFSAYGQRARPRPPGTGENRGPQYESAAPQVLGWNQALHPGLSAAVDFQPSAKEADDLRKLGFGWVFTTPRDGIMRGTSALVCLNENLPFSGVISEKGFPGLSFQKGSSTQEYPTSQMGAIALLRQSFLDAAHWEASGRKEPNLMLEAVQKSRNHVWLFEVQQKYEVLRASRLAKEAGIRLLIKGRGDEYQRMEEIRRTGFPLVLPLQFPDLPDVEDPLDASLISLADLKHWELAPANAALLWRNRIPFCFTLADLKDPRSFMEQIRKAVAMGLPEDQALAALTTEPARFAGIQDMAGRLKAGLKASFMVCNGNLFSGKATVSQHFLPGRRFVFPPAPATAPGGVFRLRVGADSSFRLSMVEKPGGTEAKIREDTTWIPAALKWENGKISFRVKLPKTDTASFLQFTGWTSPAGYEGWVTGTARGRETWSAVRETAAADSMPAVPVAATPVLPEVWYPSQAFGSRQRPVWRKGSWIIRGATVWTNESGGIIPDADVWILNGKIKEVGRNLQPASAFNSTLIDGKGRHLTCGIIDEHSHIGISRGVNEGSSTTSPEVRVGDVVEADDVNIYRHLAGGVTAVQQLHGSANAIGGQSSLIKMRWGAEPDSMKIDGADGFIKFALGENVKQSNWGDRNTIRYPQTRMGVEQLFYDAFSQARAYMNERDKARKEGGRLFRRDLKLETLAEILEKKRFISCHSYVQSEINMLMHVADSMGFRVNTFTHILEGYKVADKLKKHGAGASTFSDWWAYKMEVKDAIPHNAALMHQKGVVVAINSDDAEMATRLNQEAAKAVKYGGVSEEDAWKMVTLNPARLLHLENRMGSIKAGKDADLVLWSDNPLSVRARAEMTFVDGVPVFSLEGQKKLEAEMQVERHRIIQKMLKARQSGQPAGPPAVKVQHLWHCDDEGQE